MDFALSKELEMIRKAAREFAEKEIAPFADEWDRQHYLPIKEVVRKMGELGFLGTVIPEAYGGEDMGWMGQLPLLPKNLHGHPVPYGSKSI